MKSLKDEHMACAVGGSWHCCSVGWSLALLLRSVRMCSLLYCSRT